jgi:DnaK suppressor protein
MHGHHRSMHNIPSPIAHRHGLDHRERLENMLADLLRLMAEQRGGSRNRVDVAAETLAGPGDSHAQSITQRDLDFCIGERETARLIELEAALKRLNEGTYGVCTVCGGPIMEARLDAMPETAHCMTCQVDAEAGKPAPVHPAASARAGFSHGTGRQSEALRR